MLRITYDGGKILDESLPHVDKKPMNWYLQRYLMNWRGQFRLDLFNKAFIYGILFAVTLLIVGITSEFVEHGFYLFFVSLPIIFILIQIMLFSVNFKDLLCLDCFLPKEKIQLEDNIIDVPKSVKLELLSFFYGGDYISRKPSIGIINTDDGFYTIKKDGTLERCYLVVQDDREKRYFFQELPMNKPYSIVALIYDKAKK